MHQYFTLIINLIVINKMLNKPLNVAPGLSNKNIGTGKEKDNAST